MSSRKNPVRKEIKEKTKKAQEHQKAVNKGRLRQHFDKLYAGMSPGWLVCSQAWKGVPQV